VDINIDQLLARAVKLAKKGTGFVEPNPRVGALVVKDGEIVGEGWHTEYGGPHAEVMALGQAKERARGADLLLTLEPCSTDGKTPPCTDAILACGIRRVVFAVKDPNPKNSGRARHLLMEAGVEVEELHDVPEAQVLIDDFRTYLKGTLPWVILKWAMSADGKVATSLGESKWISSEESRRDAHAERARADAIVVGRVTAQTDDPELTARMVTPRQGHQAIRVVLDSKLTLSPTSKLAMSASDVPTWVYHCSGPESDARREALTALGVRTIQVGVGEGHRLDAVEALRHLRSEGHHRILVEGGPTVHGALLGQGLADWARVYVCPLLIGGLMAPGPVAGMGFPSLEEAVWLSDLHLRVVGEQGSDFVIDGRISNHREDDSRKSKSPRKSH
jgi:diaminohydroxyphosphoribosylaminopyrimidine deaminase/5-amino-6-(5-phosphoribosylamino)uracil reductase